MPATSFSKNKKVIKTVYLSVLGALFVLIISTPYLIRGSFRVGANFEVSEDFIEATIIAILLVVGFFIFRAYEKEIERHLRNIATLAAGKNALEARLNEAFNHIGQINVQIQEIHSIFSALKKYPEDKEDFKKILRFFTNKVLGIVPSDWVLFRIINRENLRTVREFGDSRGGAILLKYNISNKALIENEAIAGTHIISSEQDNLNIKAFCIIPVKELSPNQTILIKTIISQLEMLFLVFASRYYKKEHIAKNNNH